MIPLSVPHLAGREWTYVKECLDTGWVSSAGAFVDRFEQAMAQYTGATHAVACASGTAALHVALLLAGVKPGDEVIVPTLTFIASVNAIRYAGAYPVFMDCDEFYNLDVEKTALFLEQETRFQKNSVWNKQTKRRIAAVLPVHVFGNAVRLERLAEVCGRAGIPIVEDAAESLGTRYLEGAHTGKHTGTIGELGCLSFNGNKIITTGGGGMILTSNKAYAERAKYLTTQAKDDEVRFVHHDIGFNYRLTNVQAALGLAQLEQLPAFLADKRSHFVEYSRQLQGVRGLVLAEPPPYAENNHWLNAVRINEAEYGCSRDELIERMTKVRIQVRPVWYLNHLQRPYRDCQAFRIERATEFWQQTVNLPSSVGLASEQLRSVVEILKAKG